MKLWRIKLRDKAADKCNECGLWPFVTGPWDPFLPCCIAHDAAYIAHEEGDDTPRLTVDRQFYACCLGVANGTCSLKLRALLYYRAVRALGWIVW